MEIDALSIEERKLHEKLIRDFRKALDLDLGNMVEFANMPSYGPIVQRVIIAAEKNRLIGRDNRTTVFSFVEKAVLKAIDDIDYFLDIELVGGPLASSIVQVRNNFASSIASLLLPRIPAEKMKKPSPSQSGANRGGNQGPQIL